MKLTVKKCRKLLGPFVIRKSNDEIKQIRDILELLAELAISEFMLEECRLKDRKDKT